VLAHSLAKWEAATLACTRFEFGIRLQVGVTHPRESVNAKLSELIPLTGCSESEQATLALCVRARNKLLHCELDALLAVLTQADATFQPQRRSTKAIEVGRNPLDTLNQLSSAVDVQDTKTRDEGFFGWLLEASSTGMFEQAVRLLDEGLSLANARHSAAQMPGA